ncbi:FG-GAP-like repeat-containing protein [Streptomyces sp. NPDC008150]|uniref:FG-GAP repeat domain-containing protein n=1 Tax=Streptomyces sp. NPDC008150 TaxID=3364816 RepID=UPI0036E64AE5
MRPQSSRRALQLASALVAAGLCLSAAPQAMAADDSGSAMKLSSAEAKTLAANVSLDPYGDDTASTVSPKSGDDTTGSAGGSAGSSTGSGSGSSLDGASTDADPTTKVTFTGTSTLEGARGMGATVPVGKDGDYFTLTSLGTVQRRTADGTSVWERTNTSLYADWGVKPLRVWQTEPYPAHILMGYNAVSPFSPNSDSGYSTGDLTGDGTDDLVFSASVGSSPYRPFTSPGSSLTTGTFVTVVDGKTGRTLYSKIYDYATMVKIVDGTLLVADAPRLSLNSPAADTAKLTGTRFTYAGGTLTPASTWTYDTGETGSANWGDIQDLGKGQVAVSWNRAKTATADGRGHVLALDTADGSVTWQTETMLYNRQMRLDAGRKRLVAVEQADATDSVSYEVAAYDIKKGLRSTLADRTNVVPTALTVGDLTAKEGDEYAVAESSVDGDLYVNASTVRVLNGDDPSKALWSSTVKRDAANAEDGPSVWRLTVADGKLVTSGQSDVNMGGAKNPGGDLYGSLTVFSAKGAVAWQSSGLDAAPMYQDVFTDADGTHVRVVDQSENIHTYKLGNGKQETLTPLQADIAYAKATDLNKDGDPDVVMGGSSDGVWAYDGPSLAAGKPEKLWQATVPGAVHDIETGDVNGDGKPEIVVAAEKAVVVLNGRTGKTIATIDGGGQFVHSAKLADLDGDGELDILVPTNTLNAYYGDGHKIWSYASKALGDDAVFSDPSVLDGRVYTSFSRTNSVDLTTDPGADAVALNAKTGKAKWDVAPPVPAVSTDGVIHAALTYNGTFASKDIPYADGHAVVYLWDIQSQAGVGSTDASGPHQYMEIRDGRTGEVVHSTTVGGLWTHSNFFTDGGILYQAGTASFRAFKGTDTDDFTIFTVPESHGGNFATGPAGRKLLIGGVLGGLYAWDPSIFSSTDSYAASVGSTGPMGGRNYLTADLDGDGVDEVLSLNSDVTGYDRLAENLGGRYLVTDNAIHQVSTFKLS